LDPEWIRTVNERFAPKPDLVFILDVGPPEGLARISRRGTRDALFERESYLRKVRRLFRTFQGPRFVHLDGKRDKRDLGREILDRTLAVLGE
ncbi:MAG TPA: thymidylate kinase, partial [Candidatus Aminicenantes bacterium]|nr:thymidylate kinase [Candidatus Aminicenantes bacterium]